MSVGDQGPYLAMKRVWHNLTGGPWVVVNPADLSHDEGLRAVIAASGIYAGDYATASVYRGSLVGIGAITVRTLPDGTTEYRKAAEFPAPDSTSWVEKEQAKIDRVVKAEQARRDHEWQLQKAAQDMLDAPFKAAKRADFLFLLNEAGLNPGELTTRLAAIEAALETLVAGQQTRQLAAQTQNGQWPEEVGIHE
jgi:hypothetical protein